MSLRIIKPGLLDTIQDTGRNGFQYLGVNPTGAMDKLSAQTANIIVGNDAHEAVIEMHFPSSVFLFQKPTMISLGGADFSASINGDPVPLWHPIIVTRNCVLQFHGPTHGARAYLAVKGGFKIPIWLKSASTNLKAKAGGFLGKALQKNDELSFCQISNFSFLPPEQEFLVLPWQADMHWGDTADPDEIFVLPGNEWNWLSDRSQRDFLKQNFVITPHSDRMGYRLNSASLQTTIKDEVISSAVGFGTIQLLPGKQLIVLMADHQTTGGYPRISHVITAHHSKLAQKKAGDKIQFSLTDQQTAESLLMKQNQHLQQLESACEFRLTSFLASHK